MKKNILLIAAVVAVLIVPILTADEKSGMIDVKKISDKLYLFKYNNPYDYHHLLYIGKNGSLLIDTGYADTAEELYDKVKQISPDKKLYLAITHSHNDHIQGNYKFKNEAVIISHPNTRDRFFARYYSLPVIETAGSPELVLENKIGLYIDDQEIVIEHTPKGHSDGDITIYFPNEKLLFAGDIIFPSGFPLADINIGGDAAGYLNGIKYLLDKYADNTTILATHGGFINKSQLQNYYERLSKSLQIIKKEISKGLSADQIFNGDALKDYKDWSDANSNLKRWWINAICTKYDAKPVLISINEPVSKALIEEGSEAAVKKYYELKNSSPVKYEFAENQLNQLGYELIYRNMKKEAIAILKLNAEVFANSSNVYDSLAEAYMNDGQFEPALQNYRKSLELDPSNANAKRYIQELQEKIKK